MDVNEDSKKGYAADLKIIPSHPIPEPIGQVVFEGTTPNLRNVHFRIRPKADTTAGRMVAIAATDTCGSNVLLLARVDNTFDHNPHEDSLSSTVSEVIPFETKYALEGDSTVIFRLAHAEILEEAVLDQDGQVVDIRAAESLARSGAWVYDAGPDLIIGALGLEPDPSLSLNMGLIRGTSVSASLSRKVVQRHILICGGIGSGKSYTRGVLAEELACQGVPQINIDVNGEMIQTTQELGGINLRPGKGQFTLPLSSLTGSDVVDAIPAINKGTNIETLVQYAHEQLLKERAQRGEHFGVEDLCNKIIELAPALNMNAATSKPAEQRARSLQRLKYIGEPFNWERELQLGRLINIDCRELLVTDLRLIVAAVARDLQRLAKKKKIPFVALSVDEFHLVAPSNENIVTTQVLRELARMGRHIRIGLILTTQSPSDVDRSILKRLLTRFLHAIEPDQLDSLRGVFSDASAELVKMMPKLPVGTCVVTGAAETIKHATLINIRTRKTTHGGQTPDIWSDFSDQGWKVKSSIEALLTGDKDDK